MFSTNAFNIFCMCVVVVINIFTAFQIKYFGNVIKSISFLCLASIVGVGWETSILNHVDYDLAANPKWHPLGQYSEISSHNGRMSG